MKKYNVFKVLLMTIFASMLMSLFIPQSQIGYYTSEIEKGAINPINFVDSISNGLTSFSVFIGSFIYILCIGILYAVIKKTGKYDDVINNTACKFKNKKGLFLIISILTFGLLTAVIGDIIPMLVLVPAFIDVAKKLGYNSNKAIASTIGAIILGSTGSLYTNYINQILKSTVTTNIIAKIIILVISLVSLIIFVLLGEKPEDVKLEENKVKKAMPITVALDIILFFIILGMVPWNGYFGFQGFSKFYNTVTDFKVFDISLFNAFVGSTLAAFGEWSIYNLIVLLVAIIVILSLIYKLKVNGTLEVISKGIKEALPYALILIIANMVLVGVYNSGFFNTVVVELAKMKDSVLSGATLSALSSVVYPDYTYAVQFSLATLTYVVTDNNIYLVLAIIFQAIYSLCLLMSPTSVLLLIGLHYEKVEYKSWIKYIYKYFLILLITFLVIIMILGKKYITSISFITVAVLVVILVLFTILSKGKKVSKKEKIKTSKKEEKEEVKSTPKKTTTTKSPKKTTTKSTTKKNTTKKKGSR